MGLVFGGDVNRIRPLGGLLQFQLASVGTRRAIGVLAQSP